MTEAPSTRTKKKKPFLYGLQHEAILQKAIIFYHLLTARQVTRLLYSRGTIQTVKAYLTAMTEAKLTQRIVLATVTGKRPYAYHLGLQGKKTLEKDDGYTITTYFEQAELQARSFGWIMHLLELNDFLIAAGTLTKSVPAITLTEWLHDFAIAKNPPAAIKKDGKIAQIHPDGYLHFTHTVTSDQRERTRHYRFLVELDRGSESEEKIRRKIRDYLTIFESGELHKHFNAFTAKGDQAPLIIVFPTTAGDKRVETLRNYTRLELKAQKGNITPDSWSNRMFKFTSVAPNTQEQPDPKTIFCTPIWVSPYSTQEEKTSLISL